MIFCVMGSGSPDCSELPECDIAIFGFDGLGEVDYERELKGETEKFECAARLSKTANCGVLCGCYTISRGLVRKSVAVSDRGRLLGISDMNHVLDSEKFKSGSSLGFFTVGGCKIGLCIENDLLFPDAIHSLTDCGCSVVIAVLEEIRSNMPPLLIRAYAYLYGVPIIMVAGKTAYFADTTGAIASSVQDRTLFDVSPRNDYHVVITRRKGISEDEAIDY